MPSKPTQPHIYDTLDRLVLERRVLLHQTGFLRSFPHVHLLTLIRYLQHKPCDFYTLYFMLRAQYRARGQGDVGRQLKDLKSEGYIVQNGKQFRLTQTGRIALQRINDSIESTTYRLRKKDADTINSQIKHPKI